MWCVVCHVSCDVMSLVCCVYSCCYVVLCVCVCVCVCCVCAFLLMHLCMCVCVCVFACVCLCVCMICVCHAKMKNPNTKQRAYLLKMNGHIVERPQHMLMRVSIGIHGEDIKVCDVWCRMYDVWCMMYDVWCMLYDVWCMMYDVWCMIISSVIWNVVNVINVNVIYYYCMQHCYY